MPPKPPEKNARLDQLFAGLAGGLDLDSLFSGFTKQLTTKVVPCGACGAKNRVDVTKAGASCGKCGIPFRRV